jgi:hypothetical protein
MEGLQLFDSVHRDEVFEDGLGRIIEAFREPDETIAEFGDEFLLAKVNDMVCAWNRDAAETRESSNTLPKQGMRGPQECQLLLQEYCAAFVNSLKEFSKGWERFPHHRWYASEGGHGLIQEEDSKNGGEGRGESDEDKDNGRDSEVRDQRLVPISSSCRVGAEES